MKRRTFYHLSLGFPYLILLLAATLAWLLDDFQFINSPGPPDIILGSVYFYLVSAIIWGPLYTWMVIVFLIWSRRRRAGQIRQLYLLSPVVLACSMGIPVLVLDIHNSGRFLLAGLLGFNQLGFVASQLFGSFQSEVVLGIGVVWFSLAAICLVVGYAFVGAMVWVERKFERRGIFKEEESETTPL